MNRHRRLVAVAVAVAGVLTATACSGSSGSSGGSAKPQTGGTITFAEQPGSTPTYIFPLYNGANSQNANITYLQPLMWLPLYWFGHSNNDQATINYPQSMANPPVFSNGGKTVTMTLKKYNWSNGKPVTSRDLEFWTNLLLAEKTNSAAYVPGGWMDHVTGVSAPNPSTFVLKFNVKYNPTYLLYNGLSILQPIPQAVWDKTSATGKIGNYDETPSGAKAVYNFMNKESMSLSTWDTNPLWQVVDGPWHLKPNTGFQVTGQVTMIPNKSYSGPDKPKASEFQELPFTSSTAEFDALQSGSIDYGYVPTTETGSMGRLKSEGYKIEPWYEWGITFVGINFSNPKYAPLENQLYIRQAMQRLVDQPTYISNILKNYGQPTYGPVPTFPESSFLNPAEKTNPYPYSTSAAKSLLTQHGWTIPSSGPATCTRAGSGSTDCGAGIAAGTKLSIPLMYGAGIPSLNDEIQAMQSAFSSAGIQLQLTQAPFNTVLSDAYTCIGKTTKQCPASSTALSSLGSPVYTYVPIYYPNGDSLFGCGGATNGGNYCNQQAQALIKQMITGDPTSAQQALENYQILLAKDIPVLWFPNSAYQISAISSKLGGVAAQDSTGHIYPSVWYKQS